MEDKGRWAHQRRRQTDHSPSSSSFSSSSKMDGNGEGAAVLEPQPSSGVSCSICLDLVLNITGGRSRAKLQCGHEFHLGKPDFVFLVFVAVFFSGL